MIPRIDMWSQDEGRVWVDKTRGVWGQDVAVSGSETIAVVIPTFNSQATIRRALDSVRNQTLAPTEIIVVDNSSTDSTCEEVERFATSWSEMKLSLIRLTRIWDPAKARNIGWESCSTSLIAFLDSDDHGTHET